ncbi:glycosyltransferase [Chitinophaga sp. HK235]|uniref:glycosyltransferase family 2 protein n=1 Tax=Chitinophaga sp. HK235 TaxID=2952571 RepID=UPI001BAB039D|nr:glycosyltransferase [Chitinophaga sp. HK235]
MRETSNCVDIVIPSFRLGERYLIPLIELPKPEGWTFNYFIIVDNPEVKPGPAISKLAADGVVNLFINSENLGASGSRNKGIDAGKAPWILFLDDDIVVEKDLLHTYVAAIRQHPDAIGFIGLTDFPAPINHFTEALDAYGITAAFRIANVTSEFMWGTTANMMFNRAAMGDLRFSDVFSKNGGGEDMDLPARICIQNNKRFLTLKEAKAVHPWWNDGRPHYDRSMRYGAGTGHLLPRFKSFTWYGFPNPIESLILFILTAPLIIYYLGWTQWLILIAAVFVFDLILNYAKSVQKGFTSPVVAYYVTRLRWSTEWGTLITGLRKQGVPAFMQRINADFSRPHHFRLNRWRITKFVMFALLVGVLIWCR